MIIQGINVLANVLSVFAATPGQLGSGSSISILSPFLLFFIFGVLLWFLSDKLSAIMVRDETQILASFEMKASDLQGILFSVIGLSLMGNALPKLLTTLTNMYTMRDVPNMIQRSLPGAVGTFTQIILGAIAFLGSSGLVNVLKKIRSAGLKSDDDSDEEE
jgi:hypothetical protein